MGKDKKDMPSEKIINKLAKKEFEKDSKITDYWFPIKSRWGLEKDIFGVFDCLIIDNLGRITFIQLTTKPNIRARVKKIKDWINKKRINIITGAFSIEVWGWSEKEKEFKKIIINYKSLL